jgi:hypothetical protein
MGWARRARGRRPPALGAGHQCDLASRAGVRDPQGARGAHLPRVPGSGGGLQSDSARQVSCRPVPSLRTTLVPTLRLLSRLLEAMGQDMLGVREGPTIRQQSSQLFPTRVHRELQDHVVQVGPRLEPMSKIRLWRASSLPR